MKESNVDPNKWRDILCSWVEIFHIVSMSVLSNLIYRFNIIPNKISASYLVNTEKTILNWYGGAKDSDMAKNKVRGVALRQSINLE